jgi:hypothetical protein
MKPRLESLEERNLLSHLSPLGDGPSAPILNPRLPVPHRLLYPYSLRKHPLNEKIVGGHVKKVPMFYGPFVGQRTENLDAIGANGRLIFGRGFVFTGEVLGPISATRPAEYVFGIDRGGASAPGPFPFRAMIYFDALVTVSTGPSGATGTVELLNTHRQVTSTVSLPANAVQVEGDKVQVQVPAGLLPSTSPSRTHLPETRYFYAFWAGTGTSATDPSDIASFAPEYAITPVLPEGFPKG